MGFQGGVSGNPPANADVRNGMHACALSHFISVQLFAAHGPQPARLLCPWNSPDKNTGVGCHFLLQGIFLNQGSNPHLSKPAEPGEWTAVGLVLPHFYPLIF